MRKNRTYFFPLLYIGRNKNDSPPKSTIELMFEIHTIHPKAVPAVSGIPKTAMIAATKNGYVPNPLLVNAKEKLPTTKVMIIVPKGMEAVSSSASMAV